MLIIGIAGGTGSGKTTVVKKIIESLPPGEVVLLPQDSYYKDNSHVPVEKRQYINFDHPDAFDWPLLSEQVTLLKEGKCIEQPTYSYLTCCRLPETIHIEPRDVVIIEGILALCDPQLASYSRYPQKSQPASLYQCFTVQFQRAERASITLSSGGAHAVSVSICRKPSPAHIS